LEDIISRMTLSEDNTLVQRPRMSPSERNRVLKTMKKAEGHSLFAVMGGIFSEGVDLPGGALVTAVMVGPSLPMADLSRRLMQEWYEKTYGEGFRYAWVIPGMARVVQAAGRVIRSAEDRGIVVLIGKRFNDPVFKELFPSEWNLQTTSKLGDELKAFWNYNT
jgi:DNA excision repair protein ERCC-2